MAVSYTHLDVYKRQVVCAEVRGVTTQIGVLVQQLLYDGQEFVFG